MISLNDILTYYKLLSNIQLINSKYSLPIELKVKVLQNRFNTYFYYKKYNEYIKQEQEKLLTDRYKELIDKENRTKKESEELDKIISDININIKQISDEKLKEVCLIKFEYFDDEELEYIIETNCENYPIIDNQQISPELFLLYIFDNLVEYIPYNITYKEESPN